MKQLIGLLCILLLLSTTLVLTGKPAAIDGKAQPMAIMAMPTIGNADSSATDAAPGTPAHPDATAPEAICRSTPGAPVSPLHVEPG